MKRVYTEFTWLGEDQWLAVVNTRMILLFTWEVGTSWQSEQGCPLREIVYCD